MVNIINARRTPYDQHSAGTQTAFGQGRFSPGIAFSSETVFPLQVVKSLAGVESDKPELLQTQGYAIYVEEGGVKLCYEGREGLINGITTLKLLLDSGKLPLCDVEDWPSLATRAIAQTFSRYAGYGRLGFDGYTLEESEEGFWFCQCDECKKRWAGYGCKTKGDINIAMVRFGQLGKLKKEKINEYVELHANTWPGVLKTITECNLQNYSMFLHGDLVFSYFEYTGEDYDADMAKMAADPVTQDWWKCTHPCFEEFAIDPASEFYHDMKPIFYHK